MEIKTYVLMAVSVIAAAVVFGACLPVFADTTQANDTFTNDEYFITMDKIDSESEHTITWNKETSTKITVDGKDVSPNWNSITIVAEEDNLIRCTKAPAPSNEYYLNLVGTARSQGAGTVADKSVTITISGGVLTFTGVTSTDATYTFTSSFTEGYIINPDNEGDYQYIMKTPTAKAYVLGDSEIYGIGYSSVGGVWQNIFVISGTLNDGLDVSLVSTTLDDDPTISNEVTYSNQVSGYNDLYQFEKVTFDAEYNGNTTALTYSYVIVPSEVVAERSVHPTGATLTLMELLPVLIGAGLLIGVVGAVIVRRL